MRIGKITCMAALISAMLLVCHDASAEGGGMEPVTSFDASKCPDDPAGLVYFALHDRVFRQPAGNLDTVVRMLDKETATYPAPPQPSEPEGCPGHPFQGGVYYLTSISDLEKRGAPDVTKLSIIVGYGSKTVQDWAGLYKAVCSDYHMPGSDVPGFAGCSKPNGCGRFTVYQSQDDDVSQSGPITLLCKTPLDCKRKEFVCDSGIHSSAGLTIKLLFLSSDLPIESIPVVYRLVRNDLQSSEVLNFPWVSSNK